MNRQNFSKWNCQRSYWTKRKFFKNSNLASILLQSQKKDFPIDQMNIIKTQKKRDIIYL